MGQLERKQNQRQVCQKMKARIEKGYWTFAVSLGLTYEKDKEHGKILVPKQPDAMYYFFCKKTGHGTTENALLYRVFSDSNADDSSMVDLIKNNWNQVIELFTSAN